MAGAPASELHHCVRCTTQITDMKWPRACPGCGHTEYGNPVPAVVMLVPFNGQLIGVRRGAAPGHGQLALPGGFVNHKEPWEAAACREVLEETGVVLHEHDIRLLAVKNAARPNVLLVIGIAHVQIRELPPFIPNEEVTHRILLRGTERLAFPAHQEMMDRFFAGQTNRHGLW